LFVLLIVLAACGDNNKTPQGDPPILSGLDTLPKQLATIALTPTATEVIAGIQPVDVNQPTPTLGPPQPTATMTPYVGIFMGEPTSESGEDPIPTLAPYVVNPVVGGPVSSSGGGIVGGSSGGACTIAVMPNFSNAYGSNANVQQRLGCPTNGGISLQLVTQPFERGNMFWRDTKQIYSLASTGQLWLVADSWQEGMAADDPAYSSPPGGMSQPVRGFGLAWRSNQAIRDALGWATLPETPYTSVWQDFERGAMFIGNNNLIYAIYTSEGQHSGPLSP
jgi:hypothetical protein